MIVKLENICKSFGKHQVLKDINLQINDGEFIIIMGKSGSGKSTLCNIIGLLDQPTSGKVYIDEKLMTYKNKEVANILRYKISYLFQNFALIDNKTVGYNLSLIYHSNKEKKKMKSKIEESLKSFGLEGYFDKKVYECSGGEQQRIAIVRTFLKEGELIICDEPTGSLDDENKELVMKELIELHRSGKTIIMVTHDTSLLHYGSRIIEL